MSVENTSKMEEPRHYQCVLADPPWAERGGGKVKRGADRHYPLLSESKIIEAMLMSKVWNSVGVNAHLWMWVTNNHLESGLFVMRSLGFKYKTNAVWAKDKIGLGYYMRGQHELCLFGVRGKLPPKGEAKKISTLVGKSQLPRTKHSLKPDCFYDHVMSVSQGPYLEMFARHRQIGWDAWGNEIV